MSSTSKTTKSESLTSNEREELYQIVLDMWDPFSGYSDEEVPVRREGIDKIQDFALELQEMSKRKEVSLEKALSFMGSRGVGIDNMCSTLRQGSNDSFKSHMINASNGHKRFREILGVKTKCLYVENGVKCRDEREGRECSHVK